jgi:hypothetical protein
MTGSATPKLVHALAQHFDRLRNRAACPPSRGGIVRVVGDWPPARFVSISTRNAVPPCKSRPSLILPEASRCSWFRMKVVGSASFDAVMNVKYGWMSFVPMAALQIGELAVRPRRLQRSATAPGCSRTWRPDFPRATQTPSPNRATSADTSQKRPADDENDEKKLPEVVVLLHGRSGFGGVAAAFEDFHHRRTWSLPSWRPPNGAKPCCP